MRNGFVKVAIYQLNLSRHQADFTHYAAEFIRATVRFRLTFLSLLSIVSKMMR